MPGSSGSSKSSSPPMMVMPQGGSSLGRLSSTMSSSYRSLGCGQCSSRDSYVDINSLKNYWENENIAGIKRS